MLIQVRVESRNMRNGDLGTVLYELTLACGEKSILESGLGHAPL